MTTTTPSYSDMGITTTVKKPDPGSKLGVDFKSEHGDIIIVSIDPAGLVSNTLIQVDDVVVSVNGVGCHGMDPGEVLEMIISSRNVVTLVTDTPAKVMGAVAVAATHAQSPPGLPEGGFWGEDQNIGNNTWSIACIGCLCLGPLACFVLACPQDKRIVYRAPNGRFYDATGRSLSAGPISIPTPLAECPISPDD